MIQAADTTPQTSASPLATEPPAIQPLALSPKEAAQALAISPRLLYSLTASGELPCVRLSERKLIYPVHLLREYLAEQAEWQSAQQNGRR